MTREELSCIIQTYKTKQQNKNKTPEDPVEYLITEINKNRKGELTMKKFECEPCGYIYDPAVGDPDGGIAPGTAFEDIPDDWVCPINPDQKCRGFSAYGIAACRARISGDQSESGLPVQDSSYEGLWCGFS